MAELGFKFYRSDNEFWLLDKVPAKYIKLQKSQTS